MATEPVLTLDNTPGENMSPRQRNESKIFRKMAKGDYAAILEAFHPNYHAEILAELKKFDQVLDNDDAQEGMAVLAHEAITSVTFPYLFGADMYRTLEKGYTLQAPIWPNFCDTQSVKNFKTQKGDRPSAFPDLEQVEERENYKEFEPGEEEWNAKLAKYGGIFSATWEATLADDMGAITQWAQGMGNAARRLLDKKATAMITDNSTTTYDSVALLSASVHGNNLYSTAMSEAAMDVAYTRMTSQVGRKNEYLNVDPEICMVAPTLELASNRIFGSTVLITGNTTPQGNLNVLSKFNIRTVRNPYITTSTDWFLMASPAMFPVVRLLFLNGNSEPELFRSNPGNDDDFYRDTPNAWKVRIVFGKVVVDHVGIVGYT